jgi:hypothetical protein
MIKLSIEDYSISYRYLQILQILKINKTDTTALKDNIQEHVVIIFFICYIYFLF